MAEKDEYIREAYDTLVQMSADEKKQMEYKAREKALRDYQSQMQSAETAGFRKGLKRAKRVFQLNAQGKTPAEIADICQLTEQDVRDILE